jgi:hypothetical protein
MLRVGYVASMGQMRNVYKTSVRRPEWKRYPKDLGLNAEITLEWIKGGIV